MSQREEEALPHSQSVEAHMLAWDPSHVHSPVRARTKSEIQASQ